MATPPDGSQGPGFDWLYGKQGRQGGGSPDDESTQVIGPGATGPAPAGPGSHPEQTRRIPVQRRDPGPPPPPPPAQQRQPVRPVPPPVAPPPSGPTSSRPSRFRSFRFWRRAVLALLVLWLVFLVVVPIITWQRVDKIDFEPDGDRPADQPGTTYLMVGSDSRAGLSKEERQELSTGDTSSELTDTILLLHTGSGPSVLLSIPRDSQVPGEYGSPNGMVNGLFAAGGYPLLAEYLEDATGIRVDQFVEIGFAGVAGVVDAVGGIEVCPKEAIDDPLAGLDISKGCQDVDGTTALAYSRSRKQSTLGDLDRVQRQREVVGAIGSKVLSPWSVVNPVRYWRLNNAVPDFFKFGDTTNVVDAARWALAMGRSGQGDNLTCTMPITDATAHTWDTERAEPLWDAITSDQTDEITRKECTASGLVSP